MSAPLATLHANVQPIARLLGKWSGVGAGVYPTIKGFSYEEDLVFSASAGKPFVSYVQRTWMGNTQRAKPMHEESGFLRFVGGEKVEAVITQATGLQEVLLGSWNESADKSELKITLDSAELARTPSAKHPYVTKVQRVYTISNASGKDVLSYEIGMATETTKDLTNHLKNSLNKVE